MVIRVSSVTYTIISKTGISHTFKNSDCFAGLWNINSGIDMVTHGKWGSVEKDPVEYIIVYPKNVNNLADKVVDKWFNYLLNHRYWSTFLTVDANKGYRIAVGNKGGDELLALCTFIRYVDEIPLVLTSFYNMTSLDYVENEDICFLLSLFILIKVGKPTLLWRSKGIHYNDNHLVMQFQRHKLGDIVKYASPSFPYKEVIPYMVNYKFNGVYDYFDRSTGKCISSSLNALYRGDTMDKGLFKDLIISMQEEVREYGSEKENNPK